MAASSVSDNSPTVAFLPVRLCFKGHKKIGGLLDGGEYSLFNIKELSKQVAVFVQVGGFGMMAFFRTVKRGNDIEEDMLNLNEKLSKTHRLKRFFKSTEIAASLMEKFESDMEVIILSVQMNTKLSSIIEALVPLL